MVYSGTVPNPLNVLEFILFSSGMFHVMCETPVSLAAQLLSRTRASYCRTTYILSVAQGYLLVLQMKLSAASTKKPMNKMLHYDLNGTNSAAVALQLPFLLYMTLL